MLSAAGGCELATNKHVKTVWKKFKELLPVLSLPATCCCVYMCPECYASFKRDLALDKDLHSLRRNNRAIIRQFCNVKPEDVASVRSNELLAKLEIDDLEVFLREKRLRWFGQVERSSGARDMQIEGKRGPWRSKMTWRTCTERERY